jgi:hypothetical protein
MLQVQQKFSFLPIVLLPVTLYYLYEITDDK